MRKLTVSAIQAGAIMAVLAVIASAIISHRASDAYGVCMACHGRDLLNWLLNASASSEWPVAPEFLAFPALTTVGVLLGSFIAAIGSGEFRRVMPGSAIRPFLLGVLVINCALIAGGCVSRLLLRASTGELLGLAAFAATAAGVITASYLLKWWAQR